GRAGTGLRKGSSTERRWRSARWARTGPRPHSRRGDRRQNKALGRRSASLGYLNARWYLEPQYRSPRSENLIGPRSAPVQTFAKRPVQTLRPAGVAVAPAASGHVVPRAG